MYTFVIHIVYIYIYEYIIHYVQAISLVKYTETCTRQYIINE